MKAQSSKFILMLVIAVIVLAGGASAYLLWPRPAWSEGEIATLRSLWIGTLPPLAPDASNRYGDDPAAAALGERIFFDVRFSSNGEVACATCHLPQLGYQDSKQLSEGVGISNRRSMPIAGTAYSPWFFWDGRKDSLWAQALGPLENPVEHGGDRTQYAHLIAQHYREEYETIFGPLPDLSDLPANAGPVADAEARAAWDAMSEQNRQTVTRIYTNLGKALAAYERRIMPTASRFDTYVEAVLNGDTEAMETILTADEVAGMRLFIGRANCLQCHNGPLLTDNHFHNTGVPAAAGLPEDTGRTLGAQQVLADEFNCLSPYSDAMPEDCGELRFMVAEGHELERQFKAPSLRNVAERAPYMHAGQFDTLDRVLAHYNAAPTAPAGHSEVEPLQLSETELDQLVAFLHTLSGPIQMTYDE
ncbi:MAG: c-type cytochrome [Caldilineaceae bacterium]|nr:c-type cytochrome [Caldilineaceae bacterium]